jgi:hypothetical protein
VTAIAPQVEVEPVVTKSELLRPVTDSLKIKLYEIELELVSVELGANVVTDGGNT